MKNKIGLIATVVILAVAAGLLFLGDMNGNKSDKAAQEKLSVTASFYPMEEFVRQVGGDKVAVNTLVTPGVEPHDFEPSPKDLVRLRDSALFVYNGAGLEPWVEKISSDLPKDKVRIVNASKSISLLTKDDHEEEHEEEAHTEELTDPHVWLDPVLAQVQVTNIANALVAADPKNASVYRQNAEQFNSELAALDAAFKTGLSSCERRTIVTSHQAFTYLASRYTIDIKAISGLSPDEEPSPQKLAEVAEFAKQNNVRYIFFETLASPKLSNTIAREIGAKTLVLNPLEGLTESQAAANADYISIQKENLKNLQLAMGCK